MASQATTGAGGFAALLKNAGAQVNRFRDRRLATAAPGEGGMLFKAAHPKDKDARGRSDLPLPMRQLLTTHYLCRCMPKVNRDPSPDIPMRPLVGIAVGVVSVAIGSLTPALAADPQWRTSPPSGPAAERSAQEWTGFYLGGFAGGSFGGASQGYSVTSTWVSENLPSLIPFVGSAGSQNLGLRGADLGVEAGYDWRIADRFVFGVVGDVNWSDLNGLRTDNGILPIIQFPYSITQSLSSDWRGSLRARVGYTPIDNLLLYATGGLALGHFTYSNSFWDKLEPPFLPGNEAENAVFHAWRPGWTLGGGAEWALDSHWSIKGEYRFSQYTAVTGTGVLPLQQPPSNGYIAHSTGEINVNDLRAGVDYHFN